MKRKGQTGTAWNVLLLLMLALLVLVGCTPTEPKEADRDLVARRAARGEHTLKLVYPEWSSEIAGAHLIQAVLQERLGYRVTLVPVEVERMWIEVADGNADILAGAWLPVTHRNYYETYGDRLEELGPNLAGARIGLVVPAVTPGRQTEATGRTGRDLVTVTAIDELAESAGRFGGRIVGIESGSGVVARTHEALQAYGLERLFRVVPSDEGHMSQRVSEAVRREQWIVFTGWTPHWLFERYNLRFLEDPLGVFGGEESIHTMVREGFTADYPEVAAVLARLNWEPRDLERLMLWIRDDVHDDAYGQAVRWIENNRGRVDSWVEGIE